MQFCKSPNQQDIIQLQGRKKNTLRKSFVVLLESQTSVQNSKYHALYANIGTIELQKGNI